MSVPVASTIASAGLPLAFPVVPPVLVAGVPAFGPTSGGNKVLLLGLGLSPATGVSFGGTPATIVSQDLFGFITVVTAPAHAAGTVSVTLTTATGTSNAVSYTYIAAPLPPTAASITPVSGPVAGGTPFTITGTGLSNAAVLFGALPATGVVVNVAGTSLTGVTPPGVAGNTTVTVITPLGTASVPGGYTYIAAAPTATAIIPATGLAAGGTPFVITGSGLSGATVTVGGVPATGVVVDPTGTVLFGITPAGAAGNVPVVVTTPAGNAAVPGGYTFV
ncbi:IPT/TIG domain-containing protein [Streptomyces sp. NPDC058280]|uniref:IPT/TIG domain-containing protein n=1 Tax=Streptomyces sp. NPDC058280 TaxID=3346419 RepID=UPI0036E8CB2C